MCSYGILMLNGDGDDNQIDKKEAGNFFNSC